MRKIGKVLLTGAALFALTGTAVAANGNQVHVLNLVLPDGTIAHVRYVGDVAPKVVVLPFRRVAIPVGFMAPDMVAHVRAMDAMMARMDAQTDALLRQAAALSARAPSAPGNLRYSAMQNLPAGTVRYSYFSSSNGRTVCTQAVQVTSLGANQPPKVVSQSSGNCGAGPAAAPQKPRTINFVPVRPPVAKSRNTV